MNKTEQLKGLQAQRLKIMDQIENLKYNQRLLAQEMKAKCAQLKRVNQAIKSLRQQEITVSEHAILRYLERVCHVDLDEIRSRILNPRTRYLIETLGDGSYCLSEPATEPAYIRVRENVVVTVYLEAENR